MSTRIAPIADHARTPRDALCAQAAQVLRTTAQQWGMRMQPLQRRASHAVPRTPGAAAISPCASVLAAWAVMV